MRRASPLLILISLLSAGCAVGPDYHRPDPGLQMPAAWTGTASPGDPVAGIPADRWWTAFGDSLLDRSVEQALVRNQDLAAAAGRILEASALAGGARSQRWPTLEVGGTAARNKSVNLNAPGFFPPHLTSYQATATVRWEADLWGRLSRGEEAAVASLLAGEQDRRALMQTLIAEVVRARLEIGELDRQLDLNGETVHSYRNTLRTVEDRYRAGLVSALDLHLARQNLAAAEAARPTLEQGRAAAARRLQILCGEYPDGGVPAVNRPDLGPELPPVPDVLPGSLLERRPDLAAAELRLHAATAQIGQAKAALYPRISLTATGGTTAKELGDLGKEGSDLWSLVGNLVMPLINRGAARSQVEAAEARTYQALAAYRKEILEAFAEAENALDQDRLQQQRLDHLAVALDSARQAAELSEDRYRRGLDSLLVLLESQRRHFTTGSQYLTTARERRAARVNLILALGGSWDQQAAADATAAIAPNQGVQP